MSNINIQPLNTKIIVKDDPRKEVTEWGIIIPDSAKEGFVDLGYGIVKRVSTKVPEIKQGDRVMYPKSAGKLQDINGTAYRIIDDREVWGVETPQAKNEKDKL
jgi:chaperonin GroES